MVDSDRNSCGHKNRCLTPFTTTSINLNLIVYSTSVIFQDYQDRGKRVSSLLDTLQRGSQQQFISFCDALRSVGQHAVVDRYLTAPLSSPIDATDAPIVLDVSSCRPVSRCYLERITANYNYLVDNIINDVIFQQSLDASDVVTKHQLQIIQVSCELL